MIRNITADILEVGARDKDRRLFDEIIPLPDGTSYNSYIIKGSEKTVLIDTVDPVKTDELIDNLVKLGVDVDYIIANHAEQDHSGSIPAVLDKYPKSRVLCSEKCKQMLVDLLGIKDARVQTVADNETFNIGGKTLQFIYTPWVHWPETMSTFVKEDKVLFSCDFFGSHLAVDELYSTNDHKVEDSAKRYYAEIMMPYVPFVKKNLQIAKSIGPRIIAPSHGPIFDHPEFIMNLYEQWLLPAESGKVLVLYVSMHGSTKKIAELIYENLHNKGSVVKMLDLNGVDLGEIAMELLDCNSLLIGGPVVINAMHPSVLNILNVIKGLKPQIFRASVFGSFGWSDVAAKRQAMGLLEGTAKDIKTPLFLKGAPKGTDLKSIDTFTNNLR